MTPSVPRWIRPGGVYLVSGIIGERELEITAALTDAGFQVDEVLRRDDWVAIASVFRP